MLPVNDVVVSPETAMFYCEVSGVLTPNITWMMNDSLLVSGGNIVILIDTIEDVRNSTLRILNIIPNDAGDYICEGITAAGNVTASAELTVNCMFLINSYQYWHNYESTNLSLSLDSPEITAPPPESVVIVNEGMVALFQCNATGIPAPNITWRRPNDSSEFNELQDPRVSLEMPTAPEPVLIPNGTIYFVSRQLTLSNTTDSDSGFYFCQASGGEGDNLNTEIPFELYIRSKSC